VLQRHDSLPAGIEATVSSYFGGADGATCTELERLEKPGQVGVRILNNILAEDSPSVGVGESHIFCLLGFAAGPPIPVTITDPAGGVRRLSVPTTPNGRSVIWGSVPGDPVGTYRLEGRQGKISARLSFRLDHQLAPPLLRVVNGTADGLRPQAGSAVQVALAGFAPGQVVRLLVYRATSAGPGAYSAGPGAYSASVEVRTDGHGERLYMLQTARSDPRTCFILRALPTVDFRALAGQVDHTDAFCLS
jgi:hypothetical protein